MGTPFTSADQLIGKTPLLELTRLEQKHGLAARILAKVEAFQPAGSVKDRVAKAMLDDGRQRAADPGTVIIEPTSGNTGIALAPWRRPEDTVSFLHAGDHECGAPPAVKAYGAELVLTEGQGDERRLRGTGTGRRHPQPLSPRQFENPVNAAVHQATTGPEIWADTAGAVDLSWPGWAPAAPSGVGTYLKQQNPKIRWWQWSRQVPRPAQRDPRPPQNSGHRRGLCPSGAGHRGIR
ncbi:MAG: pyridoxal-phosphate dependent enzyme [Evtepia gabavorous]